MPNVQVDLADRSYDILVEDGLLASIGELIKSVGLSGKCALITDSNVGPLYAEQVMGSLCDAGMDPSCHVFPAGEGSKSMSQASELCSKMIQSGHDRSSFVIALGGGVTGDLAGFVAAIFYRGIPFVQIPTTIVAQVDSSAGGKTGVNAPEGKNLIGAFHQPRLVVVDPLTLVSLSGREYREGYAEAIKHAAIRDEDMIFDLSELDPADQHPSAELLARNLAIKARVVEEDERETSGTTAKRSRSESARPSFFLKKSMISLLKKANVSSISSIIFSFPSPSPMRLKLPPSWINFKGTKSSPVGRLSLCCSRHRDRRKSRIRLHSMISAMPWSICELNQNRQP